MTDQGIISSVEEFRDAILNYEVKEVSSDLIFNFPGPGGDALYNANFGFAWTGSSATLYDLLVLNQRFQSASVDLLLDDPNALKIDPKVLTGLQRGVGFGFGYQFLLNPQDLENTDYPAFDVREIFTTNAVILDKKDGPFTAFGADGNEKTIENLTINQRIPTQTYWQELLEENISKSVDSPIPIPEIVFTEISRRYANFEDPATIFGNIIGIKDGLFFGGGGPGILKPTPNDNKPINGINFLDGFTPEKFSQWNEFPESFVSSLESFELAKSLNKRIGNNGSPIFSLEEASEIFYEEFLRERLEVYSALDNAGEEHQEYAKAHIIHQLVVLVRAFQAYQLGSSALNTGSNGEGFSNAANPLVGRSYEEITLNDDYYIDTFAGQEFIVDNVKLPAQGNYAAEGWLSLESSTNADSTIDGDITYPSDGWFSLDSEKNLAENDIGGGLDDYRENLLINNNTIKFAVFDQDTVSSDTLSAAQLTSDSKNTLNGETLIFNDAISGVQIDDLVGFGKEFLPDEFSTFISLAGGVDRVTGSDFVDVIIGPGESNLHGTLTFDSGDGEDFVRPGRGQSLFLLGEGADIIAYSKGDLFGQSIILDYSNDEDILIYEIGITAEIDSDDRSILYLRDNSSDAVKTILLSGESDPEWSEDSIIPAFELFS